MRIVVQIQSHLVIVHGILVPFPKLRFICPATNSVSSSRSAPSGISANLRINASNKAP